MTNLITVTEAQRLVSESVSPLASEPLPVSEALGRVLASDVLATGDVPRFASSAMDGYAVQAGPAGRRLSVIGESRAGTPAEHTLEDGQAIRISTGAAVPDGATAVIPQEDVGAGDGEILTHAAVAAAQNIRSPGEDMRAQTTILTAGAVLGGVELGAAVAAGLGTVQVARRPRVAVLCTGDELRAAGETLGPGEIHNSNAPMLTGLSKTAGAGAGEAQRLPDDRQATREGIVRALASSDVVLISGGVSVGPHDHVKPVLADLGVREVFWGVALQPGKPTWFGCAGDGRIVFGLPGNPVSAVVTFSLFVLPALAQLQGATPIRGLEHAALLGVEVRAHPRREQAIRVRLRREDGGVVAMPNGAQGSHVLTSLIGADALAMIPAGGGTLPPGTTVRLEPLAG